MAITYQTVVDLARIPLNDSDKVRYTDADLLAYANSGVLTMVKRRPDLFIGQYANLPSGSSVLSDTLPVPAIYVQTLSDYVTGRAETADDEHVNTGRAAMFAQLFGTDFPP